MAIPGPTESGSTPAAMPKLPVPAKTGKLDDANLAEFWNNSGFNGLTTSSRETILKGVPTIEPTGVVPPGVGTIGGEYKVFDKSTLGPNDVVGGGGFDGCIGVIVVEPGAKGRIVVCHFQGFNSPAATFGTLYKWKFRKGSQVIVFGGNNSAPSRAMLANALQGISYILLKPSYLPYNGAWVNSQGTVYVGPHTGTTK